MRSPHGAADLARQLALFGGAYALYSLVRGQVDGRAAEAFANARTIIDAERALGVFPEPAVHGWAERQAWAADAASWIYVNSHTAVTVGALVWLYARRNESFYFVRNMIVVAMGLALVLYAAFPTAPPRLLPEWGFTDSVAAFTGVDPDGAAGALINPFAAVPSMHVAFALMVAGPVARLARRRLVRAVWAAYPALVTFSVVATANHWWLDAAAGAATAAAAAGAACRLAAWRPAAWRFQGAPATAA